MASVPIMLKGFVAALGMTPVLAFSPPIRSQNAPKSGAKQSGTKSPGATQNQQAATEHISPEPVDYWKQAAAVPEKPQKVGGPAPRHNLSSVCNPAKMGIQFLPTPPLSRHGH